MDAIDDLPIVRERVWLYAKEAPVRVRILASLEIWELVTTKMTNQLLRTN
jgi:hypothetical protein